MQIIPRKAPHVIRIIIETVRSWEEEYGVLIPLGVQFQLSCATSAVQADFSELESPDQAGVPHLV